MHKISVLVKGLLRQKYTASMIYRVVLSSLINDWECLFHSDWLSIARFILFAFNSAIKHEPVGYISTITRAMEVADESWI